MEEPGAGDGDGQMEARDARTLGNLRREWRAALAGSALLLVLSNWVLRFELEQTSHHFNGASANTVMTHSCGFEAVYDERGVLVEDPANVGNYNFFNAWEAPFRHQLADRIPWVLVGNGPEDPTGILQRFGAWARDLGLAVPGALSELAHGHFAPQFDSRDEVDCSTPGVGESG